MRTLVLFGLLFGLWQLVQGQLTPWDNQLFDFGWEPYDPTIVRCSTINVTWSQRRTAEPDMQAPFSLIALTGGYQPFQFASTSSTGYNWNVQLPTGGPYIMTMKDANGYTGGTSLVFQVTDPTIGTTCDTNTFTPNNLTITTSGSFAECSGITVTAQGGTAPYTMQILVGMRPPKTTTWTTSTMSYTIDLQPSEQFFVLVTDANGNTALGGIYTVETGDTACYNVATTVVSGLLPTTLSYDPSSTVSIPPRTSSGAGGSIVQNTATTTVTTVVTFRDGSSSTYTLGPNASIEVEDRTSSNDKKINLPAIIGGAVGGVAFVVVILFIMFLLKRRDIKRKQWIDQREAYERRRLSGPPMIGPLQPGMPYLASPGREHAPLMAHMDSGYTGGTTSASTTPASIPPAGYVGLPAGAYYTNTPWTNPEPMTPHAYANPVHNMHHPSAGGSDGSRRPSLAASMNVPGGSDTGLPPGAMAPVRMGSISSGSQGIKSPTMNLTNAVGQEGRPEKATFSSAPATTMAPPPSYSAAHGYRP
ncbi:hypothetical protein CPB86DRAFT_782064 [Serendipita vermifera]|nr:hypothetical protein CPB86DRAFT_782064 [Serendipita vermifera]